MDFETGKESEIWIDRSASMSKYLGICLNEQGIDWDRSIKQTSHKAREITNLLRSYGFNEYGWTPSTIITAYKPFIRPMMEYGLAETRISSYWSEHRTTL
jgi:hypothetical protein